MVGEPIASHAHPAWLEADGTLVAWTSSPVWADELAWFADVICVRLRGRLGAGAPAGVEFVELLDSVQ